MVSEKKAHPVLFILIGIAMILGACRKADEYPLEPQVTFKDFIIQGDSAKLIFEFTDGDGDIGLDDTMIDAPFDPNSYFHYNLYIRYYEKDAANQWNPGTVNGDTIVFRYRIKPFQSSSSQDGIKGTIEVSLSPLFYNPSSATNTHLKYTIELIDRALNKSNLEETVEIIR
jgi:hypothetical protein